MAVTLSAGAATEARPTTSFNRAGDKLLIPAPTRLAEWRGKPFFDRRSIHAYAFVIHDLRGTGAHAIGADVDKKQIVFNIELSREEVGAFTAQFGQQFVATVGENPTLKRFWGIGTQAGGPPIGPIGPGGGDPFLAKAMLQSATEITRIEQRLGAQPAR